MSRKVTCEFFYFGVSCFYKTSIDAPHTFLSKVINIENSNWSSFQNFKVLKDVIVADMNLLATAKVGGVNKRNELRTQWVANGNFMQLEEKYVYIYVHEMHAALSSVDYSQLQQCFFTTEEVLRDYPVCEQHSNHDFLAPYFMDNDTLLTYYANKCQCDDADRKKAAIEALSVLNGNSLDLVQTPYYSPSTTCNNWDENDWTKRLYFCIKNNYNSNVYYTATDKFPSILCLLRCEKLFKNAWCLQGSWDMMFHQDRPLVTGACSGEHEESSADESLEAAFQKSPLKGKKGDGPPESWGKQLQVYMSYF
jgi:hypothetical protein